MRIKLLIVGFLIVIVMTIIDFTKTSKPRAVDTMFKSDASKKTITVSGIIISNYIRGDFNQSGFQYKKFAKYRMTPFEIIKPLKERVILLEELEPLLVQAESTAQGKLVINWQPILILMMKNILVAGLCIFLFNLYLDKKKQTTVEISEISATST